MRFKWDQAGWLEGQKIAIIFVLVWSISLFDGLKNGFKPHSFQINSIWKSDQLKLNLLYSYLETEA